MLIGSRGQDGGVRAAFAVVLLLVCGIVGGRACRAAERGLPGEAEDFNFGWKFHKGELDNAQRLDFDDAGWRGLDLPHDWSIEGPFSAEWASGTGYLPGGVGWYRKSFSVAEADRGRKFLLYFGGVYKHSDVWINGEHLGRRPFGYISFCYDLTPYLEFGGWNVVAVRADHSDYADSRWYTGSGIYREVTLLKMDPLHIEPWGVQADAQLPSLDHGRLDVAVSVRNDHSADRDAMVTHRLHSGSRLVAESRKAISVGARSNVTVRDTLELAEPELWDVDGPHLYTLTTRIVEGQGTVDQVETKVGFRKIGFDADEGFFLNGRNLKLKGVCMHHDAGALGAAVPYDVLERRLGVLKELGCNAIRTSHNPFASEFYELTDRMGFLVIDETFDEWEEPKRKWVAGWNQGRPSHAGYAHDFESWAERDLRDHVRRDRNHPSIIMWSIGNEIDYPNDPYTHEILSTEANPQTFATFDPNAPHAARLGEVARRLVAVVKENDSSRPVTAGLASVLMSNEVGYAQALDVVGYNYQEFRYERDHASYPERVIYGSENGMAFEAWQAVTEHDYVLGQFLWTGIEYLGEAGVYPRRHSTSGLIDLAGHGKPEFYYRQSLWSDEPMVFIGAAQRRESGRRRGIWSHHAIEEHWNFEADQAVRVTAFSNCESVELMLNGRSLGRQEMGESPQRQLGWEVPFEPGRLIAVARNGDEEAARFELTTASEPARLVATGPDKLVANRRDVAHVEVRIVDDKGVTVYAAREPIRCEVSGPVRLLGMEDANPYNVEDYKDDVQHAYKGRLLVYLQAMDSPGQARVTLSAAGLDPAEFTLEVVPAERR